LVLVASLSSCKEILDMALKWGKGKS
jgi:hypothetical protein